MENHLNCRPEPNGQRAHWVQERIRPFTDRSLQTVVPSGFERYVRICQPAWLWQEVDPEDSETFSKIASGWYGHENATPIRWDDVAKETETIAHGRMQWYSIAPPKVEPGDAGVSYPIEYEITQEMVETLFSILCEHSGEDQECLCAFWQGYGIFDHLERAGNTKINGIGQQEYFLFNASLGQIRAQWASVLEGRFETSGLAPNALWPATRDWYYSVPIGPVTSYFGGPANLIEKLRASTLETYRAYLTDDIWNDDLNQSRNES